MSSLDTRSVELRPTWARIILIASVVPVLLIVLAGWLQHEGQYGVRVRAEFHRSDEYQRELLRLLSLLKDAETGQRGYLISGDRSFLEPYDHAVAALPAQLSHVESLARIDSEGADLRLLKALIDHKFTEMGRLIALRDKAGLTATAGYLKEGEGKRVMDEIRAVMGRMDKRSRQRLAEDQLRDEQRFAILSRIFWFAFAASALIAAGMAVWIGRDRRLRHLLTLQREDAAARQRAIFESGTDGIILINPSGSIETINPAAEQMFGYQAADLLRRDISTLVDIAPGDGSFLARLGMRDGQLTRKELIDVTAHTAAGGELSVDIVLGTMLLPDGVHVVAALRDATSRKEIDRLKDDFISTVSHELRTPLTSVVGSLGLLRSGAAGILPEMAQRLAEIAETNSQRLIRLINDILDIDQIRKGRMAFDYGVVDLRDLMSRTLETMQGLADRRSITVDKRVPATPVMACADIDRLIQVAGNLLSNAIKFSPEGSTVLFELIPGEDDHVIQVIDSGPGVAPDFAPTIFSRFARGVLPAGQKVGGTGLGLAISREIVRSHGGEISFENRSEGGAVFAFSIPRDTATLGVSDGATRLLICENDGEIGRSIQSILNAHGYVSDMVMTMRDGIAHARAQRYDAVLLNPAICETEGFETLRATGPAREKTPLVIISDTSPPSEVDANSYAGWLRKPVDPPRLVQLIQRAIRRADQRKAVILHVDDDDDTRELFAAALAGRGLLVNATTLASAGRILTERRPDAIVLDLGLPDGSGRTLLEEVKRWPNPLPVIVYSAQEIDNETRRLADAVLVKSRRALPKLTSTVLDIVDRHGGPQ